MGTYYALTKKGRGKVSTDLFTFFVIGGHSNLQNTLDNLAKGKRTEEFLRHSLYLRWKTEGAKKKMASQLKRWINEGYIRKVYQ